MLKAMANIYSSNEEDFNAVANALLDDGFDIAYQDKTTGIVIKEVNNLAESGNQNA